jgi:hypothetical protein
MDMNTQSERERLARLLHDAHSTWRATPLLRWEDTPEVHALYLRMADAVLADRHVGVGRVVDRVKPAPFVIEGDPEMAALEARLEAAERRVAEAHAEIAILRGLLAIG